MLPSLRQRYFAAFSVIFAFSGLITSVTLARWRFNPVKWSVVRLRSVLLELSEAKRPTEEQKSDSSDNPGSAITASGDE